MTDRRSLNFEFLRHHDDRAWKWMFDAELSLFDDHSNTITKAGMFNEIYTMYLAEQEGISLVHWNGHRKRNKTTDDLIRELEERGFIDRTWHRYMDNLRYFRNKVLHPGDAEYGHYANERIARQALEFVLPLARDYIKRRTQGNTTPEVLDFQLPPRTLLITIEANEEYIELRRLRQEDEQNARRDEEARLLWPADTEATKMEQQAILAAMQSIRASDPLDAGQLDRIGAIIEDPTTPDAAQADEIQRIKDEARIQAEDAAEQIARAKAQVDAQRSEYDARLEQIRQESIEDMQWMDEYPEDWSDVPDFFKDRMIDGRLPFPPPAAPPTRLGAGGWSEVWRYEPKNGTAFAVKIPRKFAPEDPKFEQSRTVWEMETGIAAELKRWIFENNRNPIRGLARPLRYPDRQHPGYIFYELANGWELAEYFKSRKPMRLDVAMHVTAQVADTIQRMLEQKIHYTDIKLENIVLQSGNVPVLVDPVGLYTFSPPEWQGLDAIDLQSRRHRNHIRSGQCYLCGLLLLNLVTGNRYRTLAEQRRIGIQSRPRENSLLRTIQAEVQADEPDVVRRGTLHDALHDAAKGTDFDSETVRELASLLDDLLRVDPDHRRREPDNPRGKPMTTGWIAKELRRHYDPNGLLSALTK